MLLIGHRGAKGEAPENTLAGFSYLRDLGIQSIEFDIQLSADNQLVIIHDDTLERTTERTGNVRDFTAKELATLNASAKFSGELGSQASHLIKHSGLPTLEEVLSSFDHLQHAQLEVKPPSEADHKIICNEISRLVKKLDLTKVCYITSSDVSFLESCQKLIPDIQRGFVFLDPSMIGPPSHNLELMGNDEKLLEILKRLGCKLLAIHFLLCKKELVELIQKNNIHVSSWTVNEIDIIEKLGLMGLDSIITDFPKRFKSLF